MPNDFAFDCERTSCKAKIRKVIKPAARSRTTVKLPKHVDVSKPTFCLRFQEALAEGMNAVAYTSSWNATKDDLYKVAKETIDTVAAKSRDWFDENDQAISDVLAAISNIRSRMMQKDLDQKIKNANLARHWNKQRLMFNANCTPCRMPGGPTLQQKCKLPLTRKTARNSIT